MRKRPVRAQYRHLGVVEAHVGVLHVAQVEDENARALFKRVFVDARNQRRAPPARISDIGEIPFERMPLGGDERLAARRDELPRLVFLVQNHFGSGGFVDFVFDVYFARGELLQFRKGGDGIEHHGLVEFVLLCHRFFRGYGKGRFGGDFEARGRRVQLDFRGGVEAGALQE